MTTRNAKTESGRAADDRVTELSFDDAPPPRAGDPLSPAQLEEEFPAAREQTAGISAGTALTDDDLGPETLFHVEENYGVYDGDGDVDFDDGAERPADQTLQVVGAAQIGGGSGKDEAELAREEHPDK
jgi:hypothetical protein